jgi:hypothetical protein
MLSALVALAGGLLYRRAAMRPAPATAAAASAPATPRHGLARWE